MSLSPSSFEGEGISVALPEQKLENGQELLLKIWALFAKFLRNSMDDGLCVPSLVYFFKF